MGSAKRKAVKKAERAVVTLFVLKGGRPRVTFTAVR